VIDGGCKGNVLVILMKRPYPWGIGFRQPIAYPFGAYTSFGLASSYALQGDAQYIGLQVGSTYDVADMARTVPGGLLIATATKAGIPPQKQVIIEHRSLTVNLTLIGKSAAGLAALLDKSDERMFPSSQKLAIAPTFGSKAAWEYSKPPGFVKSVAQGLLSVGAWFGAKKVLPASWVESVEYMPTEEGVIELAPAGWIVPCTHGSASYISKTDAADVVSEYDGDDDDSSWTRDYLDDDEWGQPTAVIGDREVTSDPITQGPTTPETDPIDQDLPDTSEDPGGWEYTPVYEGFDGWGDGGFGMDGHRTLLDF